MLHHDDGSPPVNPHERAEIWRLRCEDLESGHLTTANELWQRAFQKAQQRGALIPDPTFEDIPSIILLESKLRKIKKGKTAGNDGFRSDLYALAAPELAVHLHALAAKFTCYLDEAVQHKGGTLIAAYKGSGAHSDPCSYRSLLMSSHLGKALRSHVRDRLLPEYCRGSSSLHFACKKGGNVSHASHLLRAFMASADAQGHSYAALYVDIASAFYRVIRELIVNLTMTDEEIVKIMQRFHLEPQDFQELRRLLSHPTVLQDLQTPLRDQAYLEEMMANTWYSVPASEAITYTAAGTRPGDNLADLIFAFIYSKTLETFRRALTSEGFSNFEELAVEGDLRSCTALPVDCSRFPKLLDVTWADDLVILLHTESALDIDNQLALVSGTILDMCWQRGLLPNFKPRKTECMICFKGKGSKAQKIKYFSADEPALPVPSTMRADVSLRIVPHYKHLGSQIHRTLKQIHEIRIRVAQARAAYAKHRKHVYQNSKIKLTIRVRLLQTMVLSILNYNMGTWRPLSTKEWTIYEGAIMYFYRGLLRATHRHDDLLTWPNEKILATLEVPSAWDLLTTARLRYLGSLWRSGPQEVWWCGECL